MNRYKKIYVKLTLMYTKFTSIVLRVVMFVEITQKILVDRGEGNVIVLDCIYE